MGADHQTSEMDRGSATARMLAVLSLAVVAVLVLVVIAGSGGGSGSGDEKRPDEGPARAEQSGRKYYVIEFGDTFDAIAARVGVPTDELQRLNPNLDTQQLPITGCINLVPNGCKVLAREG